MLPLTILPSNDIATFDIEPNSAELLPQAALEPSVTFADILNLGAESLPDSISGDGMTLPLAGNELPSESLPEAGSPPVHGAEGLVVPLPDSVALEYRPPVAAGVTTAESPLVVGGTGSNPSLAQPVEPGAAPSLHRPTRAVTGDSPRGAVLTPLSGEQVVQVTRDPDSLAPKASARTDLVVERAVAQAIREIPTSQVAGAVASAMTGEPTAQIRRSDRPLSADLPLQVNTDKAATTLTQAAKAVHGEFARERGPRPISAPVPQPAPQQLGTAGQFEMPQGVVPQHTAVQLTQVPTSAQPITEPQSPLPSLTQAIELPVKDAAWSSQLGERVVLMAANKLQSAEIRLTPAEMGPLRVQIAVDDGAANITFLAQHAITRDAIEQALPRLRELLSENGLTLNQADIGEHAEQGVSHDDREDSNQAAASAGPQADFDDNPESDEAGQVQRLTVRPNSLVDTFA